MKLIWKAAEQFSPNKPVRHVSEHGNGNINDTYLVSTGDASGETFILQRINTHVFKRPHLIVENLLNYTAHVDQKLAQQTRQERRWDVPHIRTAQGGKYHYIDDQGGFWRAISFVNHSKSYETVQSEVHAREAGFALGNFHSLVNDLDTDHMHDTLVGFHIMPFYIRKYDQVMAGSPREDSPSELRQYVPYCHKMVADRRDWAGVLEDARESGALRLRTIHGDPKINNIMISDQTGQAVSMIDLDTVKPGLVHYDIGDCLRSSCNPLGEETLEFDQVRFETTLARSILEGYLSVADQILTENDYDYIFDAIRLIPFEMGVRFFQDYLAGDIYFKVKHPTHNLERAVVQFKLTESIETQENPIREIIADLKPRS